MEEKASCNRIVHHHKEMDIEDDFRASEFDGADAQLGSHHTKVKIPPVEARRRKLILDDSDDELFSPGLPMHPIKERVAGYDEKKKGKRLVKLGKASLVGDQKLHRPTAGVSITTQKAASSSRTRSAARKGSKHLGKPRSGRSKGNRKLNGDSVSTVDNPSSGPSHTEPQETVLPDLGKKPMESVPSEASPSEDDVLQFEIKILSPPIDRDHQAVSGQVR
ncbi:unnamed protein product [Linum trigynum]|uniref:Uncharacterized protein n=1 Tax=Linum trigynum TaxID=586398 RepID=A0AAV2CXZ5_9ROSI